MTDVRLMTLDPGHFHAALVHGEMYPAVAPRVDIFAPVGPDLVAHLHRLAAFNRRPARPTSWTWEVHAAPDFLERMLRERPGNVVVLSGRNRDKIDRILASVRAGLHVLADKPWVLNPEDLPKLEAALDEADARGVVASDIMTERFEATHALQRALVNDEPTFGRIESGSLEQPAVYMESVHYLKKIVAGAPNIRPTWFFNTADQGEGLNDVGTHLVDLVQWTLFPDQPIRVESDVQLLDAQRWPTRISESEFRSVTHAPGFPPDLAGSIVDGQFDYYCNTLVAYTLRGVHTTLNIAWDWEPLDALGDTHFAYYRGTKSRIEVRQTRGDGFRPELYVIPKEAAEKGHVLSAVRARVASLQTEYPGIGVADRGGEIHVTIPDALRVGHEAHFAQVAATFLDYVSDRSRLPSCERPNMIAKYFVTTRGTALSGQRPAAPAPRLAPR
jgi:predicted dehydrogenase